MYTEHLCQVCGSSLDGFGCSNPECKNNYHGSSDTQVSSGDEGGKPSPWPGIIIIAVIVAIAVGLFFVC